MYYLIKGYYWFKNWFCLINHKIIGMLYLFFGLWVTFLVIFLYVLMQNESEAAVFCNGVLIYYYIELDYYIYFMSQQISELYSMSIAMAMVKIIYLLAFFVLLGIIYLNDTQTLLSLDGTSP